MQGEGDTVSVSVQSGSAAGSISIESITGDGGRLALEPNSNCIGIAAREALALLPAPPACGISLRLHKGLPLGSGMGSSAASAAAACWAVNLLFGERLTREELVYAGLQSEAFVSGYHADNIAPALLGGFVLVRCAAHACSWRTSHMRAIHTPAHTHCSGALGWSACCAATHQNKVGAMTVVHSGSMRQLARAC